MFISFSKILNLTDTKKGYINNGILILVTSDILYFYMMHVECVEVYVYPNWGTDQCLNFQRRIHI